MKLPENGRVVIVDDKISEALPLIQILSKKRIPFNYYLGTDFNEFPEDNSLNKFRILFLDLNIFEIALSEKSVISSLNGILVKLIPDNPNPYLLVIWSKQKDTYKDALETHFKNKLPKKVPAKIIFLKKGDYFDYTIEGEGDNKEGKWVLKNEDILQQIEKDLMTELEKISLLGNLIQWENIVHQKTNETVNEFSSFYNIDDNWDKNLKGVMFNLAKSIVGKDDIVNYKDDEKLTIAFSNLSTFLFDKVENEIDENGLGNVSKIIDNNGNLSNLIISKINSKLHLSQKKFNINKFEQGNLYFIKNQDTLIERIIWAKNFKTKRDNILKSNPQLIQLDLTPVCDYSQNKDYVRTIYGVMLDEKFKKDCKSKGTFYYSSPSFHINDLEKFLFFDFRFIKTHTKEEIIDRNIVPELKLRKDICTDIQSQLANQINRPGINNL